MKIAVVGSGFVGEATGRGLAKHNNEITFVDVLPERVEQPLVHDGPPVRSNRSKGSTAWPP